MEKLNHLLEARQEQLMRIKERKLEALEDAPEGFLRFINRGESIEYYHRTDPKNSRGKYIKKENVQLAQSLAQKCYDQKVLDAAREEILAIDKYLTNRPEILVEDIYEQMRPERQKLITPILEPIDDLVRRWESVQYHGLEFEENAPEFYTAKNERVRSKSEVMIADLLNREDIPYRYECPIYIPGYKTIYPDFLVLNKKLRKEVIWEHFGKMDDPEYANKATKKINALIQAGFVMGENLIMTFETKQAALNQKTVMSMINNFLK